MPGPIAAGQKATKIPQRIRGRPAHRGEYSIVTEPQRPEQNEQEGGRRPSDGERCHERYCALEANAEPRSERPWAGADEDADRLKVLERMTWYVVEQIKLAGDFDARKGKGTECKGPANAGTSSKASSMLLIASDNVPRVNTNRRRISLTKYGMRNVRWRPGSG
jgi:hypothetical protein